MNYYALQVKTNDEEFFISEAIKVLKFRENQQRFFFLKRRQTIRRQGKRFQELKPMFPGYVFLEAEDIDPILYRTLKRVKGFFRFLKNNQERTPLSGDDLILLTHFLSFGGVAESSKVYFDENDKIIVTEGPLQGIEGSIIKVDKRKQRVKVRLSFSNQSFVLDLSYEIIEKAPEHSEEPQMRQAEMRA
jgi:transcriptional antiterminator NusG